MPHCFKVSTRRWNCQPLRFTEVREKLSLSGTGSFLMMIWLMFSRKMMRHFWRMIMGNLRGQLFGSLLGGFRCWLGGVFGLNGLFFGFRMGLLFKATASRFAKTKQRSDLDAAEAFPLAFRQCRIPSFRLGWSCTILPLIVWLLEFLVLLSSRTGLLRVDSF